MRTRTIDTAAEGILGAYFDDITAKSKNLRNVANFYIRNVMTGIKKSPEERSLNETEVLHDVFTGVQQANRNARDRLNGILAEALESEKPVLEKRVIFYGKLKNIRFFAYPTEKKWMLSYELLDAVLKLTKNPDYYALPSQVNQQALKKTVSSWTAYFKSLKSWYENPSAYTGKPRIPGYIRSKRSTAHIPNQRIKEAGTGGKRMISLPDTKAVLCIGSASFDEKIVKVEIKPWYRCYRICVTYETKEKEPKPPEKPKRLLGLDPGVGNFYMGTYNFEKEPFIISGNWIKAENQWFNKQRARLLSVLTKGADSAHSVKDSRLLDAMSRNRSRRFDDFFYKTAHRICRECAEEHVDVIVVGNNKEQKQETGMDRINNQNFISIPYARFRDILKTVASEYQIPVIIREESYTSKASLIDGDFIPTFGEKDAEKAEFSGKRMTRGQYVTKDGIRLNADVNSAGNIARKEYPDAFKDITDWTFLTKTVRVITRNDLCRSKNREKKKYRLQVSDNHKVRRRNHRERKTGYRILFETKENET